MNIDFATHNIRRLLNDGHRSIQQAENRSAHDGDFRAGSAGCITGAGVYGECHRIAHARWLGADKPVDQPRRLMFQAGEANEDLWGKVLVAGFEGQVLRHQEVAKQGSFGRVTGHPDIILADHSGLPLTMLELKLVSATNTAIRRQLEGEPDIKNLIQTATYMWMTGLPGVLCYTSRSDFSVEFQRKKYGVTKVEPFYRLFYVAVRDGRVVYRDEFDQWGEVTTDITIDGIVAYYQRLADMAEQKQLYDRPVSVGYNRCDAKYCVFSETCDRWERDYVSWATEARAICGAA